MFSIIIPVKSINQYVLENIEKIRALTCKDWEIIIITNDNETLGGGDKRIKTISSGRVSPGLKRDIGARESVGEVLVFLDDDSYPETNFLEIAKSHFQDKNIMAIGGPGVTPPQNSLWQKASGAVFETYFFNGSPERYLPLGPKKLVEDWPSVNFMVRKDCFLSVGGFDTEFWPGEDTIFCDKLVQNGIPILYDPELIVWHHRRESLLRHAKQVFHYGKHRGHFWKIGVKNSQKILYLLPVCVLVWFVVLLFSFIVPSIPTALTVALGSPYLVLLGLAFLHISKMRGLLVALTALPYALSTHISYGAGICVGLASKTIQPDLR